VEGFGDMARQGAFFLNERRQSNEHGTTLRSSVCCQSTLGRVKTSLTNRI